MSKTQSRIGVTITENTLIPNIYFSSAGSQTFADVAGTYKVNFAEGGVSISNNSQSLINTDIPNDAFVALLRNTKWLISISGAISTSTGAGELFGIGLYKNNTLISPSYTTVTMDANTNQYNFSKTLIIDLVPTTILDFRVTKEAGNVILGRLNITLIQVG